MCLGDRWMGFNDIFFLFRLPCFFFISGWLFEGASGHASPRQLIRHKFMVQIVPTFIFLLLLAPPPLFFSRLGATKGGYWFTFALFEFILLHLFSVRYLKKWKGAFALVISVSAFCYDIHYNRLQTCIANTPCPMFNIQWIIDILGFLSFMTWRYFLFFYVGTWVKRHFETFVRWTDKPVVIAAVIVGFFAISRIPHSDDIPLEYFIFAIGGILGLTMIFTAFRIIYTSHRLLPLASHLSPLTYIGTRTLDIYLLHYFFLPRFLMEYAPRLQAFDSRLLEFSAAMLIALTVLALCLLASYVIRLSPFLGHYLFGVKRNSQ
jgi:fucose 4-O-acetylase-like acetyltransferase